MKGAVETSAWARVCISRKPENQDVSGKAGRPARCKSSIAVA
jgi:hypothetical protein